MSTVTSSPAVTQTPTTQFVGSEVQVGGTGGTVGFFGAAPRVQATGASVTDFATLKTYLQSIGLIGA